MSVKNKKTFLMAFACYFFLLAFPLPILCQEIKIHSHNDYLRNAPFWEAYANNAASIEADVILEGNTLYVAHEKESIKKGRR
jgi:alkaline phosphatase